MVSWDLIAKGGTPNESLASLWFWKQHTRQGWGLLRDGVHNSPIYNKCQTQPVKVLTLLWKRTHQDYSNDTPQPICESQVSFSSLWIRIIIHSKGKYTWNSHIIFGFRLNHLNEVVFVAKPMQTEFGTPPRLESCAHFSTFQKPLPIEVRVWKYIPSEHTSLVRNFHTSVVMDSF